MQRAYKLTQSTIGQKAIMAVSGVILFGFVISHLLGNLQLFLGPNALNEYAAALRRIPGGLWPPRLILLTAVGLHIWAAVKLAAKNSDARKNRYKAPVKSQATNYAARTMNWSGPIVLAYIVYHLGHLTFGFGYAAGEYNPHNVYNNVILGFQVWWVAVFYIVANLMLGTHLFHGAWSWFQTLGMSHSRYNPLRKRFAVGLAAFITLGNIGIPTAVMLGVLTPVQTDICYPELATDQFPCESTEGL